MLSELPNWLAATALSHAVREVGWIIPAVQTVHILSVAVAFSAAVLVNLRLLRLFERSEPLNEAAQRFLPAIWPALAILLVTGSLLIVAEPQRSLLNDAFYLKMALLLAAVLLTAGLQASLTSPTAGWEKDQVRRITGKALAAVSILVWCGVLFAGRWIAYTQAG